jgi:N-acyl-D-aspartate/D-glutamate deacylase
MAHFETIIRGGEVVDGTGSPRQRADLAIADGRIARIGDLTDATADVVIDASGKIVAPGFVDIHTHYDAQVFWDPSLSPSSYHGVTTVVGGNCGFSVAPLSADAGDYLMRMLARVEGMPLTALSEGVPWDWSSFSEYLDRLDGRLALNAGFLVGHSALRRVIMGDDAVGEEANEEQVAAMVRLLHESLSGGGLGFSSSAAPTHNDGDGKPVPSRYASRKELLALAAAVRDHTGTTLEFLPTVGPFADEHRDLMTAMSLAANRPLNWNVLAVNAQNPAMTESQLQASDYARERGGTVIALTLPQAMTLRLNLVTGFIFDALPGWSEIIGLPMEERKKAFSDPNVRADLDRRANSEEAGVFRFFAQWENMRIDEAFTEETRAMEGRTVGEIAAELGKPPFDTMLDIALADDLRTSFMPPSSGDDEETWKLRAQSWRDERTIIGATDAGAHLDMIDTFAGPTALLAGGVRQRGLLELEEAVHQLTDLPARLYGLTGRGRLESGWHADIVIFDEETIGPGPIYTRNDLPTGAARLYADALGVSHVLVAGVEIIREGEYTGATPGTVLRSGRDTETVGVPGGGQ